MSRILKEFATFVFGLIELLLVFRFVLKLFGASSQAKFVEWIYETTQPLLGPFLLAFPTPQISGNFVLEFTTLFAIFAYAFLGYIISEVLEIMDKNSQGRKK